MKKRSKVNIVSLGCAKNLVDSEKIIADISEKGGVICNNKEDADIIVINTCGFINSAKEESIDTILETVNLKEEGKCKRIVVTGCLAQRYKKELQSDIPEIDALLGVNEFNNVANAVLENQIDKDKTSNKVRSSKKCINRKVSKDRETKKPRISLTPKHYAYLKISDGCNNLCTYCSIPNIRGKHKSSSMEDIISHAELLASNGVKELNIIAQDTTVYGTDLYRKPKLHTLLNKLSKIDSIKWIRVLYAHPAHFYDELIDEIGQNEKICNYLDMPIQHINDHILKWMGRKTSRSQIEALIHKLRKRINDLVLRTSIIVGFPGETEKRFNELADFVESTRFERLGVFIYSREEETPAFSYKSQISKRVKNERYETLMSIQQGVMFENNKQQVGKRAMVLIDSPIHSHDKDSETRFHNSKGRQKAMWLGRSYADAPEVDSNIIVTSEKNIKTGTFKDVTITGTEDYNLIGSVYKQPRS